MAAPRGAIESVEGGFKVVFFCGGQQYEVQHLRWAEEAVLVCDLLTMKEAIDGQLNLKALQLRSQHLALLTVQQLRDAVCTLRGSELRDASVAEVVEQLQACVLEAPMGASRICLLRGAAQLGLTSIAQLLRVADPQAVLGKCSEGMTPLHHAAFSGHSAVCQLLLRYAPQAAMSADSTGKLPLHYAAQKGHSALCQLLLDQAPQAASSAEASGHLPLHWAAFWGHTATCQLLVASAPHTAATRSRGRGMTPLQYALTTFQRAPALDAARCLLAAGPARSALAALLAAGPAAQPLFADFVIARLPMTSKEWATVPAPCPGIGRALPAVLAHPAEQARWLVRHLPPADAQRLRTAAFSLHRAQQQLHVFLPSPVVWDILALSAT